MSKEWFRDEILKKLCLGEGYVLDNGLIAGIVGHNFSLGFRWT